MCNINRTRESAFCKLWKKYKAKKWKEVFQLDTNTLILSLSTFLNVDASRILYLLLGIVNMDLSAGG